MKCNKCGKKLVVQQTINYYKDNVIVRRRFCPICRMVYLSREEIEESYEIEKERLQINPKYS